MSRDASNQQELEKASGALTVPTVMIGDMPLAGYDRAILHERLTAAGYPAPGAAGESAKAARP